MTRIIGGLAALILPLMFALSATPTAAQAPTVSRSPATAPVLGRVIGGSAPTVFTVSQNGAVTRVSGNAIRLTSGSVTAPTITITCGLLNANSLCLLRDIRITVQATGASGESRIVYFRAGPMSGPAYRAGGVREGAALNFTISPLLLGSASFTLGMDIQVDANAQPGSDTFTYTVTAQFL